MIVIDVQSQGSGFPDAWESFCNLLNISRINDDTFKDNGVITPPMGLNCFVVSSVTGVPVHRVFRGVWIFVAIDFAILIILATFPELSLALPRWAGLV